MRQLILLLVLLIPASLIAHPSADRNRSYHRNALYVSGDWMTKNLSPSINYERVLYSTDNQILRVNSSLGYGRWYTVDSKGSNYNLNLHLLAGSHGRLAEFTLGIRGMDNEGTISIRSPLKEGRNRRPAGYSSSQISQLVTVIKNMVGVSC